MNDFLSHLAARSLAAADLILPRPTSLFAGNVPETAAPETAVTEMAVPPTNLAVNPFPEPDLAKTGRPAAWIPPAITSPADNEAPQTAASPPIQPTASYTAPPLPDWLNQLRQSVAGIETAVQPVTPPGVSPPLPPEKTSVLPGAAMPPPPEMPPVQPLLPPLSPTTVEQVITETRLVERTEQRSRPTKAVDTPASLPVIMALPEPTPLPSASNPDQQRPSELQKIVVAETRPFTPPPSPLTSSVTPPEPVIHVTIGRVEVRATSPAPKERPRRAQSPVMGLDEYLQQRANGESK